MSEETDNTEAAKPAVTRAAEAAMAPAEKPFELAVGDTLRRADGTYLAVLANANIDGLPHVIVREHTAAGERVGSGTTQAFPVAGFEDGVKAGVLTVGHAPK